MIEDGPAPFFKRLQINSASINFFKLDHLKSPEEVREDELKELKRKEITSIQKQSHFLKNQVKTNKSVLDYFKSNYEQKEKGLTFKVLNERLIEKEKELINSINQSSII